MNLYFDLDLARLLCKSPIQLERSDTALIFFCFLRVLQYAERKREKERYAALMMVPGQKHRLVPSARERSY